MKGKSLGVSLISMAIAAIASYSALGSPAVAAWLGIVSFGLTLVLSTLAPSGEFPKGWTAVMWITNGVGIAIQVLTAIADKQLADPVTINYVIIGINILMQTFIKDYGTGSMVENAKK